MHDLPPGDYRRVSRMRHQRVATIVPIGLRVIAVSLAAWAASCSGTDHVDLNVRTGCQPPHGQRGHDHEAHMAGLPTCP
jgi:hypothetical protein